MIRLYNVLRKFWYLSDVKETELIEAPQTEEIEAPQTEEIESEVEENAGLNKALDTYRKLIDRKDLVEPLTDKEQDALEKRIKEIEERDVVETIEEHDAVEIPCEKNKITIGPPTLTRFEKARIMGARALQLSLGAPPFIPIPKTARISLDISMEELEQRVIPITIRRVLPNGDYQKEETAELSGQEQTEKSETTIQIGNYPVMESALEVLEILGKKSKVILKAKGNSIPNAVAVANIITEKMMNGNSKVEKIILDTVAAAGIGDMTSTVEIILLKN
jgi:DNA-binding protein Alba